MKKRIAVLMILMTALLLSAALADDAPRTLKVNGSATILMDADSATVGLGVISVSREAGSASRDNAAQVERLITALEEAGIPRKDISTNYFYVSTRRDYSTMTENGEYPVIGYEVSNSLRVVVRDIDQVGSIIDLALASGANSCDEISFSTGRSAETQDAVLAAAIAEGRRRAEIMAEACGGTLGEILSVSENYNGAGAVINNKRTAYAGAEAAEDAGAGTTILSNGLSFSASVEIVFELK